MKRIIFLAGLLVVLSAFSLYAQLPGDFNCSGSVDGLDATFIISQYRIGLIDTQSCTWHNGDLNGDSLFHTVADWRQLLRFLARDTMPDNPPLPYERDTIAVGHVITVPGETVSMPIWITIPETILDFMIQIEIDTTYLSAWSLPGAGIYSNGHFYWWTMYDSAGITAGRHLVGNLNLTVSGSCPLYTRIPINIIGGTYYPSGFSNDSYPTYFICPIPIDGWVYVTWMGVSDIPRDYNFGLRCYPNPFNASTAISYVLPHTGQVDLEIYNLLGQKVAEVVNGVQESGPHQLIWNAASFPSGVYFARLNVDGRQTIAKLILLK